MNDARTDASPEEALDQLTAPGNAEAGLGARIEALKLVHSDTRSLARAIGHAVFLATGRMPRSHEVQRLIGRGSLSTVVAALRDLHAELRDVVAPRLSAGALPTELTEQFGAALAEVWSKASEAARADAESRLAQHRASVDVELAEAARLVDETRQAAGEAVRLLEVRDAQLLGAERALEDARVRLEAAQAASERAQHQSAESASAQRSLAADLAAMQEKQEQTALRWQESDRHHLLEIDRLRTQLAESVRGNAQAAAAAIQRRKEHEAELAGLQEGMARATSAESLLRERTETFDAAAKRMAQLQIEALLKQGTLEGLLQAARTRIESLEAEVPRLREPTPESVPAPGVPAAHSGEAPVQVSPGGVSTNRRGRTRVGTRPRSQKD